MSMRNYRPRRVSSTQGRVNVCKGAWGPPRPWCGPGYLQLCAVSNLPIVYSTIICIAFDTIIIGLHVVHGGLAYVYSCCCLRSSYGLDRTYNFIPIACARSNCRRCMSVNHILTPVVVSSINYKRRKIILWQNRLRALLLRINYMMCG